ncbi:MAG: TIGR03560 family F420-dependent LLM class oxidoreductase [Anaerolineaceae bacterium]|nr:MAG: TIGR03560 family F420-dependent LLM class oxidoreductase [Anaerolineaceae bacterium]
MGKAQIGLMIEGQDGLNWPRWKQILQVAEDSGFQCVFRSDHYTNASGEDRDSLELWVSLTYAASHTHRIEFGSLVAPTTFRPPALSARMAAQVDDLSAGRLVFGMGAGWQEREHKKFGIPFYDFSTRYAMLTDALEITRRLYDSDQPVTYHGEHFTLEDAQLLPRPARAGGPPVLIGGNGPKRTLPLAARYADEWNALFMTPDDYRERNALFNTYLSEAGRQADAVKRSMMVGTLFGRDDADLQSKLAGYDGRSAEDLMARGMIVGTASAWVDQIGALVDVGVQRFMLQWLDLDDMAGLSAIARDVLPHFH